MFPSIDKKGQPRRYQAFIFTALPCEAKPAVDHFMLRKDTPVKPFSVYANDSICLTVTGIGKCAMAAGVAHTLALFPSTDKPVMLNLGVAGHRDHALGRVFLIDKITDGDSGKNYYPPIVFSPPCSTAAIKTSSTPQLNYDHSDLCDMEASAFYETATRFASAELVQSLKVISDNQASPAEKINPRQASFLIADQLSTIEKILTELSRLSGQITVTEPAGFSELALRYHFTVSERLLLKKQLNRWACLTGGQALPEPTADLNKAGDVLNWLERQIESGGYDL
ncbi:MAG: hypothetical protein ACU84H_10365 [Gammaproteobacteria bacterium]